eukprot:GEMP01003085.1.p1 GENE.GEMP01003085.1~~GEMP01003085.1.p1  ORF type:complete len:1140 (+),score=183.37 GEMP01003085.1:136-3420(+)
MPLGSNLSWSLFLIVNVVCGIVGLLAFMVYRKCRRDKIYSRRHSLVDMWSRRARFEQATPNYSPLVVLSPADTPLETPPEVAPNDPSALDEILFVSPRGEKANEGHPSYLSTQLANTCGGIFAADDLSANLLVRNYLGFLKGCACVFAFLSVVALVLRILVIYGVLSRIIGNYVLVLTSSVTFFVAFAMFYWYLEEPYHMSKGVEEAKRTVVLRWRPESTDKFIAEGVSYINNRSSRSVELGRGAEGIRAEGAFVDAVLRHLDVSDAETETPPRSLLLHRSPLARTPPPDIGPSPAAVAAVTGGTVGEGPPSRVPDVPPAPPPYGAPSPTAELRDEDTPMGGKTAMTRESLATGSTAAPATKVSSVDMSKLSVELLKHDQLAPDVAPVRFSSLQSACSNPLESPYGTMESLGEATGGCSDQPRHAPLIHGIMEAMKSFGEVVSVHLVPAILHVYLDSLDDVVQTRQLRELQIACCGKKDEVFDVIADYEQQAHLVLGRHDIVHEDAPELGLRLGDVILRMKPYDSLAAIKSDSSPRGPDIVMPFEIREKKHLAEDPNLRALLENDVVVIEPAFLAPRPDDRSSRETISGSGSGRIERSEALLNDCAVSKPNDSARARWSPAMPSTDRPTMSPRGDRGESAEDGAARIDSRQYIINVWRPKTDEHLPGVHAMIKSGDCDPLCLAFVSFFEPIYAEKALAAGFVAGHKGSSIRMAPPASTVDWRNVCISPRASALRLTASVSGITLAAYFIAAPTVLSVISTWIRHLTQNITRNADIVAAVVQLVPFFFLYNVNSILIPTLINRCAHFARAWRKDHQVRTKFMVNYVFLVILLFWLPLLKCGTLWQLVKSVAPWEQTTSHPIRIHFSRSTDFTLQYLVSSVFIGNLAELFQFSQALYLFFFQGSEKWKFTLGYWFAYHLSMCTMALTFSAVNSVLLPLSALYFILRYAVDKYLFANDVRPFEYQSDGLTEKLILRVFLFQVTIFLGVTANSFHQRKYPLLGYSLTAFSMANALVCFWPPLFRFLPKPKRGNSHLFRMPNMGKFLRLLALSYRIPVRVASKFVSIPEGFTDVSSPWFITVVSPLEDIASDRRRRAWC